MINPNEVRPGNWVIKITGVDARNQLFYAFKAVAPDEYFYTFVAVCYPIPLTPDVIGKCGFKHDFGDWYINQPEEGVEDGMPFLRFKHSDQSWYLWDTRLPAQPLFLHQLQNLFYTLTHQELEVQLGTYNNHTLIGPVTFYNKPLHRAPAQVPLL